MPLSTEERISARKALQERLKNELDQVQEECAKLSVTVDDAQTTLGEAEDALYEAKAAFKAAEVTVSRLEESLREAKAKRHIITNRLANIRIVFDTELLAALPAEILQAIFVEVLRSHASSGHLNLEQYNAGRAVAPFILSAVCRLWRSVAVQTSELWTYVALPSSIRTKSGHLNVMIDCLLSCSQARLVDVFFAVEGSDAGRDAWKMVMPPVLGQFDRWKRASIRLPAGTDECDYSFLQHHSSALKEIHLHWSPIHPNNDFRFDCPDVLSACDALRSVRAPASILSPQCLLPGVTSLKIPVGSTDSARAVDVVCQMPMLQELFIISLNSPPEDNPSTPHRTTRLARLHTLTLSGFSATANSLLASLDAPQLRNLAIASGFWPAGFMGRHIQLFRDKFTLLQRLEFGSTTMTDVFAYWPIEVVLSFSQLAFATLRHLTLAYCQFHFRELLVYRVVWPNLETITLCGRSSYTFDEYLNIVTFLGFAAYSAEALPDGSLYRCSGPAQFQVIVRDMIHIPSWLPKALGRLVGPRNCHIIDKDEQELAPVDSDDDDATFTDSDSAGSGTSSSQSDSDSSDESDDGGEEVLTVNGPEWTSDDSDDGDYEHSESDYTGWDEESDVASDSEVESLS